MRKSSLVPIVAFFAVAASVGAPAGRPAEWQKITQTFNSVVFLDRKSIGPSEVVKRVTIMRVSGQPAQDQWQAVVQKLTVDCARRSFADRGSVIEKLDGSTVNHPGTEVFRAPVRGIYFDLIKAVCNGLSGEIIASPRQWTRRNFHPGQ